MDKLPTVSYIRMVDIWLITVQLIPFLYVIIRTASELVVDSEEINHHGHKREVAKQNNFFNFGNNGNEKISKALKRIGNTLLEVKSW